MRALVIALLLVAAAPLTAHADACRARCRDRARVCKDRCKLSHEGGPLRHRCLKECELREHECRATC